jgi:signal transduction histidine kinase
VVLYAFIIVILLSLSYVGMETLSTLRAAVGGESMWSKAQKDAVYQLSLYATSGDNEHYVQYEKNIAVLLADERARILLEDTSVPLRDAQKELINGGNSPDDVKNLAHFYRNFRNSASVSHAIESWEKGDHYISELEVTGERIHGAWSMGTPTRAETSSTLKDIEEINSALSSLENSFFVDLNVTAHTILHRLILTIVLTSLLLFVIGLWVSIIVTRNITRLDHAKKEFIALASHELRTPISIISLNLELLLHHSSRMSTELYHESLLQIERSVARMVLLSRVFLSVSKIDLGMLVVHMRPTFVSQLVEQELSQAEPLIAQKNLTIHKSFGENKLPTTTDPELLGIILQNLISNAIKYTAPGGTIAIVLSRTPETKIIEISDTGYGIPPDEQPKIFTKFSRGTHAKKNKAGGSGLGLYIAKSFVEKLGGTISVKSFVGSGSTFTVLLPLVEKSKK